MNRPDENTALADVIERRKDNRPRDEYAPLVHTHEVDTVISALRLSATSPGDAMREALETIAKGETQVFDDDLKRNVIVSMDEDEMKDIARRALLPLPPLNETSEYHRLYTKEEYDWLNLKGWHQVCHDFRGEEGMTAIRYSSALAPAEKAGDAIAFVPVHPKQGPLWTETYPADRDVTESRSTRYERMALYATPTPPSGDVARQTIEACRLAIEYSMDMGCSDPACVLLQALNKCDAFLIQSAAPGGGTKSDGASS